MGVGSFWRRSQAASPRSSGEGRLGARLGASSPSPVDRADPAVEGLADLHRLGQPAEFDPATWRLSVGGLVGKPLNLSYDKLRSLPRAEQVSTFHCVTGWTVKNVHWAGVRIHDVLAEAAPSSSAHALRFVSAENPYVDYLTLQQAGCTT